MLELKRGGRARVRTEMAEFIALPFLSSKKLKIWSFHVYICTFHVYICTFHVYICTFACTKKRDTRAALLFS